MLGHKRSDWKLTWLAVLFVAGCSAAEVNEVPYERVAARPTHTAPAPKFDQAVVDLFQADARKSVGEGEPGGKQTRGMWYVLLGDGRCLNIPDDGR